MVQTRCGFDSGPAGSGRDLLVSYGPTILVDIGFDPNFRPNIAGLRPVSAIRGVQALVDTGASESCIDGLLAAHLGLPIVDRRPISGVHGAHTVNMHLAQIVVPALNNLAIYGMFAAVDLAAGGQTHRALIGRTFLRNFTMVYEGKTGTVTISSD